MPRSVKRITGSSSFSLPIRPSPSSAHLFVARRLSRPTIFPLVDAVVVAAPSSPLGVLFVQEGRGVEHFTISDYFSMPFLSRDPRHRVQPPPLPQLERPTGYQLLDERTIPRRTTGEYLGRPNCYCILFSWSAPAEPAHRSPRRPRCRARSLRRRQTRGFLIEYLILCGRRFSMINRDRGRGGWSD